MAFSGNSGIPSSLYGCFEGGSAANNTLAMNNSSNPTNPNQQPANDLFQILSVGGACLLQVTAAYAVNTNPAASTVTSACEVAKVQLTAGQVNGLAASPTAAQTCAAAFPVNYNNQQLDIFQVISSITSSLPGGPGVILGGGQVIFRLLYSGATSIS